NVPFLNGDEFVHKAYKLDGPIDMRVVRSNTSDQNLVNIVVQCSHPHQRYEKLVAKWPPLRNGRSRICFSPSEISRAQAAAVHAQDLVGNPCLNAELSSGSQLTYS